jgi:hypothetical protein
MSNKNIVFKISPLGKIEVEANNFNGVGCENASKPFIDKLSGSGDIKTDYKEEWAASEVNELEYEQN